MLVLATDLQIDHVTIAGTDLKKMQHDLSAVGINTVYGGAHNNHATEMALVSFPDGSYMELIAIQPKADAHAVDQHPWSKFMQGNAGPCAWAVRVKDVTAEVKRLSAAGVAVSTPARSGRLRPDGVKLDWETAQVGSEPNGTFFPFLIHDFTPREQRAFPDKKPGTKDFTGVTKVVIAVNDLDAAVKRFAKAYDLPRPIKQVDPGFGAHLAQLGGTPVVLAQPLGSQSWLRTRIDQFGEGPCAFVLGAKKPGRYAAATKTRWFGIEVSWFDAEKLGWHLGFEDMER